MTIGTTHILVIFIKTNNMKPLKVFVNGKRMKDIYPHCTKWQLFKYRMRKFVRKLIIVVLSIGAIILSGYIAVQSFPNTVYVSQEKVIEIESKTLPPVMQRIAKCESGNTHYDSNGQVLVRGNDGNRKSVDVGKYQINTNIWGKKATELGFNLMIEEDNEAFAMYLYKNFGTESWVWSKSCWNK